MLTRLSKIIANSQDSNSEINETDKHPNDLFSFMNN